MVMATQQATKAKGKGNGATRLTAAQRDKFIETIRLQSALLDRMDLAQRAGKRFDEERDYYEVFGWKRIISWKDFQAKYARQDVAARIVEAPASATWGDPPTVISEGSTEFGERWQEIAEDRKIWHYLERVDKLSGLGRFAIMICGFNDSGNMERPVNPGGGSRELLYLVTLGEGNVGIDSFETNAKDERFNLPKIYSVKFEDPEDRRESVGGTSRKQVDLKVHWSRVLHVAQDPLEDDIYGNPRIGKVFNLLDDLLKVAGGSAETFWLTANRGLQADVDKEMELEAGDAAALGDALDEYQHQLRRVLRTRGVKITDLGTNVADPTGTFRSILSLLSGATGIPQRILLGSEAGQLASEQDRANWAERISERRIQFAQPLILEPCIDMFMAAGVLPEVDEYEIKWPEAFRLSPLEKAQTMAQRARGAINLSRQYEKGFPLTSIEESREVLGFSGPFPGEIPTAPDEGAETSEADVLDITPEAGDSSTSEGDIDSATPTQTGGSDE